MKESLGVLHPENVFVNALDLNEVRPALGVPLEHDHQQALDVVAVAVLQTRDGFFDGLLAFAHFLDLGGGCVEANLESDQAQGEDILNEGVVELKILE